MWINATKLFELDKSQASAYDKDEEVGEFYTWYALSREGHDLKDLKDMLFDSQMRDNCDVGDTKIKPQESSRLSQADSSGTSSFRNVQSQLETECAKEQSKKRGSAHFSSGRATSMSPGLFMSQGEESENDVLGDGSKSSTQNSESRVKRARTTGAVDRTLESKRNSIIKSNETPPEDLLSSPSTINEPTLNRPPIIKCETDEQDRLILVNIQVGPNHEWISIAKDHLSQSPFLHNGIHERPGKEPYIMRPEFVYILPSDFTAIKSFLETGEYHPKLVKQPTCTAYALEGILNTKESGAELERCGRLYALATEFQLPKLQDLIMKKVKYGFPRGWEPKFFWAFPRLVFDKSWPQSAAVGDVMRGWIINFIAENFQALNEANAEQFWVTLTGNEQLYNGVFVAKAEQVQRYGMIQKIEED